MSGTTAYKKIKLFTDRSYLPSGKMHTILLYPFWGNLNNDPTDPDNGRFDDYIKKGKDIFEITDQPADSDVFLLPFEYSSDIKCMEEIKRMATSAKQFNKQIIIFFNSDSDENIAVENAIIFRTSFYRSTRNNNEYALPGWSVDFMKFKKDADKNNKPVLPSISYCGYVDYINENMGFHLWKLYRRLAHKRNVTEIGSEIRGTAVRALMKDKRVLTNFIIRNGFWAAGVDKKQAREQYAENMLSSDYALVARGAGNFSYRLYEVLSCGKIPVFIDTDNVLPFGDLINWKKNMVWINENEIKNVAEKLIDFHNKLTENEFNVLKNNCRKMYDEYICPVGFFSNIHRYIQ